MQEDDLLPQHDYIKEVGVAKTFDRIIEVEKFNPFHDSLGRFSNKYGFATYSANPKLRAAQPSIARSARAGHGRTLNVHRESKGENIGQNYDWMRGRPSSKPAAPPPPKKPAKKPPQPAQPKQTPPKQQDTTPPGQGSVKDGKAQHAVHGKDLSKSQFAFSNNPQDGYTIEQVIKAQGFDGKPTICKSSQDFNAACKASSFIAKRGVGANSQAVMDAYDNNFKNGEFYVKCSGGSVHGYGMYAASVDANGALSRSGVSDANMTATAYARGNKVQKIYTMTLDKSAKIGTESQIRRQMQNDKAYLDMCAKSGLKSSYTQDTGVYAAYKGYDAYIANRGRMSSNGSTSDYTVILNRSKVILYEP